MVLYGLLLSVLEDVTWDFCFASLRVKLRSIYLARLFKLVTLASVSRDSGKHFMKTILTL